MRWEQKKKRRWPRVWRPSPRRSSVGRSVLIPRTQLFFFMPPQTSTSLSTHLSILINLYTLPTLPPFFSNALFHVLSYFPLLSLCHPGSFTLMSHGPFVAPSTFFGSNVIPITTTTTTTTTTPFLPGVVCSSHSQNGLGPNGCRGGVRGDEERSPKMRRGTKIMDGH